VNNRDVNIAPSMTRIRDVNFVAAGGATEERACKHPDCPINCGPVGQGEKKLKNKRIPKAGHVP